MSDKVQIFAKNSADDGTIPLEVNLTDTIASIKEKIKEAKGIPVDQQLLIFMGNILEDERTLADYKFHDKSTFHLTTKMVSNKISIKVRSLTGATYDIKISPDATIGELKELTCDLSGIPFDQQRLLFAGNELANDKILTDYNIMEGSTVHMVLRLRGGKPIILLYPPTTGLYAKGSSFKTSVTVKLNQELHFTSLIPRPETSADGQSITWDCSVQAQKHDSDDSAIISYNKRSHSYLFWEFENRASDAVSFFLPSMIEHADCTYLLNGMNGYEDWCYTMLNALGLNTREQDDFVTFWAHHVFESGPLFLVRVVPEAELAKCAELTVSAKCEDGSEVPVSVRRVYITLIACKELPPALLEKKDKFIKWNCGDAITELPNELKNEYPITRNPNNFNAIEWGGVFIKL